MWSLSNCRGIQVHQIRDPSVPAPTTRRLLAMEVGSTVGECVTNSMHLCAATSATPAWQRRTSARKQHQPSSHPGEHSSGHSSGACHGATRAGAGDSMVCSKRPFSATSGGEGDDVVAQAPLSSSGSNSAPASSAASSASADCTTPLSSLGTSERTLFSNGNASCVTGSCEDRGYDAEALLLEPLLPSPRSNKGVRDSRGIGQGGAVEAVAVSLTGACRNDLEDSISCNTNSGMISQQNGGEVVSLGCTGWHQDTTVTSATSPATTTLSDVGLLAPPQHSLVPVSPALSPAHGSNVPFTPVGEMCLAPGSQAAANGSSHDGGWYLNLPPHAQVYQPQHQQQHEKQPGGSSTTAAAVAAAAANVAAAIHQASTPFSTSGGSFASVQQQQQQCSSNGYSSTRSSGTSTSGAGISRARFNADSARRSPSPWHQHPKGVHVRGHGSGTATDVSSGAATPRSDGTPVSHQQLRFVTKEECLPAAHPVRGGGGSCDGGVHGNGRENLSQWPTGDDEGSRGVGAKRNFHGGLNELPAAYARSCSPASSGGGGGGGGGDFTMSPGHGSGDEGLHEWRSGASGNILSGDSSAGVRRGAKRSHAQVSSSPRPPVESARDTFFGKSADGGRSAMGSMNVTASSTGLRIDAGGGAGGGAEGGPGKRVKIIGSTPECSTSAGWSNGMSHNGNGWGSASNGHHSGSISPEEMHRVSPTPVLPDPAPTRRSARSLAGAASAHAAAALAAAAPPSIVTKREGSSEDEDSVEGGGDSSLDWAERDSDEEPASTGAAAATAAAAVAAAPGRGGGRSAAAGSGSNDKASTSSGKGVNKAPFKLDPRLWVVVERRAVCSAKQCAYRSDDDHRARRRHYHALCSHVHQNGERKGMRFQHHQLEKVQKHQRAHQVSAKQNTQRASVVKARSPSGSPVGRAKRSSTSHGMREQTRAIKDANVEAHSPKDWTPEHTKKLRDLVDELGPKWSTISEKIPGKTATACMLHWRVGINPHHMVKGSGTWTAEEDERLSKLVEVVGMKWSDLARHIPGRIAKQCRERYLNHLDPSLRKNMPWTEDEEALLMRLCFAKQNQWAEICRQLHGRSYNDVKNRFNLIQRRNKRASLNPGTPSQQQQQQAKTSHRGGGGGAGAGAGLSSSCSSASSSAASTGSRTPPVMPIMAGKNNNSNTPTSAMASVAVASFHSQKTLVRWNVMDGNSCRPLGGGGNGMAVGSTNQSCGEMPRSIMSPSGCSSGHNGNGTASAVGISATVNSWASAPAAMHRRPGGIRGDFPNRRPGGNINNMDLHSFSAIGCTNNDVTGGGGSSLLDASTSSGSGVLPITSADGNNVTNTTNSLESSTNAASGGHRRAVHSQAGGVQMPHMSNGSSTSFPTLMGDDLGDFDLPDTADLSGPGSGFAPGGYWHQMVKEESRVPMHGDVGGAGGGSGEFTAGPSRPSGSSLMNSSLVGEACGSGGRAFMETDCGDVMLGEEEGSIRLPPPPPLGLSSGTSYNPSK